MKTMAILPVLSAIAVVAVSGCDSAGPLGASASQGKGSMSREEVNRTIDRIVDEVILKLPVPKEPQLLSKFSRDFNFGLKDNREVTVLKLRVGYAILKNMDFRQGEKLLSARSRSDAIAKKELADYGITNPKPGTLQYFEFVAWGYTTALFVGAETQANGNPAIFPYTKESRVRTTNELDLGNSRDYAQQMLDHAAPFGTCMNHEMFFDGGLAIRGNFSMTGQTDTTREFAPHSNGEGHGYAYVSLSASGQKMPIWDTNGGRFEEGDSPAIKNFPKDHVRIPSDSTWINVPNEVRFMLSPMRGDRQLLTLAVGGLKDILPHNEMLLKLFWSKRVADGPNFPGDFGYPYKDQNRKNIMALDLRSSQPIFDTLENIWAHLK